MTHGPDEEHTLPELTEERVARALEALGYPMAGVHQCESCVPDDPQEKISGMLGGLFALVQVHVARRPEHSESMVDSYHLVREHLGNGACPSCGGRDHVSGGPAL